MWPWMCTCCFRLCEPLTDCSVGPARAAARLRAAGRRDALIIDLKVSCGTIFGRMRIQLCAHFNGGYAGGRLRTVPYARPSKSTATPHVVVHPMTKTCITMLLRERKIAESSSA